MITFQGMNSVYAQHKNQQSQNNNKNESSCMSESTCHFSVFFAIFAAAIDTAHRNGDQSNNYDES